MKKYIVSIIIIGTLASCSKWLDVTPQSEVSQDALFSTEDGFKEAINGLYSKSVKEQVYGRELTSGTVEAFVQNYATDVDDPWGYRQAMRFSFKEQTFMKRRDDIWLGLYGVVANANLILENVDVKKNLFTGINYNIIKGEALAMRAYCHFDVLRLFADSYVTDPNGKGIPYVTKFSKDIPPMFKVGEAIELVIKDLLEAKELLKADPIIAAAYKIGYPKTDSATETKGELFLQVRRHRLNYYAVCGELARVYLYKGDQANALSNALEVINTNKFPWTKQADFLNPDEEKKDRILYKELIFGLYAPNMNDRIREVLANGQVALFVPLTEGRNIYETGGVGGDDFRYKQWLQEQSSGTGNYLRVVKYSRDGDANLHDLMLPAMRLSEMYYIAAECTFDTDATKAWDYFNTVRLNRGIGTKRNDASKTVFIGELLKEARKEFFSEGQMFYMYKRLNLPITGQSGSSIAPSKAIFVLPFPDDEIAYGNR
ncbi:RagB/SusD family nutrient uptake outer membrane protein [Chitinophaga sp. SYP-B3965]|uniref:RagB/SusD family nutrient uptake outer membrane protein n=1 Tax=Chitinophaga sp. SYP-B3965 TaxID=2663120 RepID=UPI001299EC61|nr:RagB/SusD family nutrient uptake outer membrane protein [Chitinophaga sp. SYP-B3965]MRG43776.1 RagB/SusD family nutrient uptake outer membrane protein [Chitinophaga sp. SYP-B3965]